MHSFSFGELALIFGIIIVLFGGSRLATIGKSLGEGISNFKKGLNTTSEEKLTSLPVQQQAQQTPPQTHTHDPVVVDVEHKEKS